MFSLLRVFAHVYHAHYAHATALGLAPHLNTAFKHCAAFVRAHGLVAEADMEPVAELADALLAGWKGVGEGAGRGREGCAGRVGAARAAHGHAA